MSLIFCLGFGPEPFPIPAAREPFFISKILSATVIKCFEMLRSFNALQSVLRSTRKSNLTTHNRANQCRIDNHVSCQQMFLTAVGWLKSMLFFWLINMISVEDRFHAIQKHVLIFPPPGALFGRGRQTCILVGISTVKHLYSGLGPSVK